MSYHKVQKVTALINDLLGSISLLGGILGHVVSGGGVVLDGDGFAKANIAESILGIGTDALEPYVDLILAAGKTVLAKYTWKTIALFPLLLPLPFPLRKNFATQ